MVRSSQVRPHTASRKLTVTTLAAAISIANGSAQAQSVEATSAAVRGRAPVVTIQSVTNESVPGQAPATGHHLHVDATAVDPDDDAITDTRYEWKRDATVIGTGTDYTTTAADSGKTLTVNVIADTEPSITDPSEGSASQAVAVAGNTAPSITNVNFTGTRAVGETLTATFDLVDVDKDAIDEDGMRYQWSISHPSTGSPMSIEGATGKSYQLRPEDQGTNRRIWFSVEKAKTLTGVPNERARPTSPAGQWQKSINGPVVGRAPTATPSITFDAPLAVGKQLIGNAGFQDLDNDTEGTHTYKWYRADDSAGTTGRAEVATTKDYTVKNTDQGKYLVFEVIPKTTTGNPNSGVAASAVTAVTVPGSAPYVEEGSVSIAGVWKVGEELTGNYNYKDDENDLQDESATQYAWYISDQSGLNPQLIALATTNKFTLRPQDQGGANRTVWFRVKNVKSTTGTPNERFPNPAFQWQGFRVGEIIGTAPTATPTISGTVASGQTLIGSPGFADVDLDTEGTHAYQWYRADDSSRANQVAIENATGASYAITSADQGKFLVLGVKPRTTTGNPKEGDEAFATTATAVPGSAPYVEAGSVSITGVWKVGEDLTGHYTYKDDENDPQDEAPTSFAWFISHPIDGTPQIIAGETGDTYRLRAEDQGENRTVWFRVNNVKSTTGMPNEGIRPTTPDGQWQTERAGAILGNAPTATPTITFTGALEVGKQLSGNVGFADIDNDGEGTHEFKWYRADNAAGTTGRVEIATTQNYTVQNADQGKYLVFEVIPKTTTGNPNSGTAASAVTAIVVPGTAPNITNVDFSGTWKVGETLTGSFTLEDAENDQIDDDGMEYRWQISHPTTGAPTNIEGATETTYQLRPEDQGASRKIWFTVTKAKTLTGVPNERLRPTSPAGQWQKSITGAVVGRAPTANPSITFTAPLAVGKQLTGNVGFQDLDDDTEGTHTYKWYRADDSAGITGRVEVATTKDYTVQNTDQGKYLVFEVIPKATTGNPNFGLATTAVTATTVPGSAPYVEEGSVSIDGVWKVGEELTGTYTYKDDENDLQDEAATQFAWYISDQNGANPQLIGTATTNKFTLRPQDQGGANRTVWFRVKNVKSTTGTPNERFPNPVHQWQGFRAGDILGSAPTATPSITFTGSLDIGKQLTGNVGFQDIDNDTQGTHEYKWYRADDAEGIINRVEVATTKNYTVQNTDKGKYLVFEVVPKTTTGNPNSGVAASAVTATVVNGTAPTVSNIEITGTYAVGQKLTGSYDYTDVDGDDEDDSAGGTEYQWYLSSSPTGGSPEKVTGATGKEWTIPPEAIGSNRKIWFNVEVVRSKTGTPNERTGPWGANRQGVVLGRKPTASASISGTVATGQSLAGSVINFEDLDNDPQGTHVYQWYRADNASRLNQVAITGATGTSYTITSADQGKFLVLGIKPRTTTGNPNEGDEAFATTAIAVPGTAPYVETNSVSISGTYAVGQTLTGAYQYKDDENDPENESASGTELQWYMSASPTGGSPIAVAGATGKEWVIPPEAVGSNRKIWFNVNKVRSTTGTPNERTGPWGANRQGVVLGRKPTAEASIAASTLATGQTLTGSVINFEDLDGDAPGTHVYQWYRANDASRTNQVAISGATGTNYTLAAADQGMFIVLGIKPRTTTGNPNEGDEAFAVTTAAILGRAPEAQTPSVGINPAGALKNGTVLTASYQYYDADNDGQQGTTFQWFRKVGSTVTDITNANSSTYTLSGADQGDHYIGVKITPKSATGSPNTGTTVLPQTADKPLGVAPTATVSISGTPQVGIELTGSHGYTDGNNDSEGATSRQWYTATDSAGNTRTTITGATTNKFTVRSADQGKWMVYEVTPRSVTGVPNVNGNPVRAVSARVNSAPTASPTITHTGTLTVGTVLTANPNYQDVDNDSQSGTLYQWCWYNSAGTSLIGCATASTSATYTVPSSNQNNRISVKVTPKSATGNPNTGDTVESTKTAVVPVVDTPSGTSPTIEGVLDRGQELTASFSYTNGGTGSGTGQGAHVYTWYRSNNTAGTSGKTQVQTGTNNKYMQVDADQGKYIIVEITPKSANGTSGTMISASTTKELRYRTSGTWWVYRDETIEIPLVISNRSGNAPADLKAQVWRNANSGIFPNTGDTGEHPTIKLIGPQGAQWTLSSPAGEASSSGTTVNASTQTGNGTWKLQISGHPGWTFPDSKTSYTHFTLEFTP